MRQRILQVALLALALALPRAAAAQTEVVTYYHTDGVGSVRLVTDAAGQVVAEYDYLPFGQPWQPPVAPDPRGFGGKEHDVETGLDYFGARYYASSTGRFTTVDPLMLLDRNREDPQSWNRYAYARNNPLRYVDPDGRFWDVLWDGGLLLYSAYECATGSGCANLAADALAAVIPFVPAGTTRFVRAADSVANATRRAGIEAERGATVLGHYPGYINTAKDLGTRYFDVPPDIWAKLTPAEQWAANTRFLDRLVKRGDDVILSTPANKAVPNSFFARELEYLTTRGYTISSDGARLVAPRR